ncbi:Ubiquinone biosynthesis O-methyltransferase, mitochondrial (plasmid) [Roseobacter fucihabitans]|uniref:Ubiquinone biosynthesis O-methyltransferase, mitochondrial n=1 Tax=Roseobacter fucihabitans TaxID=1537242 RepID=A0ABZ2C0M3_9RHOB|nr:class I SAM-dependent methyltransferase [Roseobacter litoralis]MBC6966898.1 Ubiquinone biosynthesis O-methyltransferase [Roseobacter litoralis]
MDGQQDYRALSGTEYDSQWDRLSDFIIHNPGARHRRRNSQKVLQHLRPGSVLDVGCGTGDLILLMRDLFTEQGHTEVDWVGADIAAATVESLGDEMPWADFKVFDITEQKMDRQFDLVTCCEVIEHLDDAETALKNLADLVKPGGYLFISCPTGKIFQTERLIGHIYHPKPDDLRRWGTQAGLVSEQTIQWGWPMYLVLKNLTNVNTDYTVKHFGSGAYSPLKVLINKVAYWGTYPSFQSPWSCQLFWLFKKPQKELG